MTVGIAFLAIVLPFVHYMLCRPSQKLNAYVLNDGEKFRQQIIKLIASGNFQRAITLCDHAMDICIGPGTKRLLEESRNRSRMDLVVTEEGAEFAKLRKECRRFRPMRLVSAIVCIGIPLLILHADRGAHMSVEVVLGISMAATSGFSVANFIGLRKLAAFFQHASVQLGEIRDTLVRHAAYASATQEEPAHRIEFKE